MSLNIEQLLNSYPRKRPEISKEAQIIYEKEYMLNRNRETFITRMVDRLESWMHKKTSIASGTPVLELGAGTLNHLKYEISLTNYDIVEPFESLFEQGQDIKKIRNIYRSVAQVPDDLFYERIISIATLEHMIDLPLDICIAARHLSEGGLFQAGIPTEGGLLWGMAWRFSTGISYRIRTGLSYKDLMRHEHINNAQEILLIINNFFRKVRVMRFPLPLFHISFYTYIEAEEPIEDCILTYLESRKESNAEDHQQ